MNPIGFLWVLAQVIVGFNLIMPLLLLLVYRVRRERNAVLPTTRAEADYAIIVTAYQQTSFLPEVVSSLLHLHYNNYLIYIVADNCDVSDLRFSDPRVILLRPETTIASNTGSHFYAINRFRRPHERLTIIDSDNLVDPKYLNALNVLFDKGYRAVQGIRAPKNLNSPLACLDAARDIYYHYYDGKILFGAGSSATLAGSGMAFETELYRDCLEQRNVQGAGFDKVLQYEIVKRGHRIAFAENAVVLDEKTIRSEQLVKQRARWINTWFRYFVFGFTLLKKGFAKKNGNQFLFGLMLLRPPLFLFLLLSLACLVANLFLSPVAVAAWLVGIGLFIVGFLISLLSSKTDGRIYRSLLMIPRFVFLQILSLTKVPKANKYSVATQHFHNAKAETQP